MSKNRFLSFLGITMLISLTASESQADGKRVPISFKFAGAFISNVQQSLADGSPTGPSTIIHVSAWGFPGGRVLIRGFGGQSGRSGPGRCPLDGEPAFVVQLVENPLVMTFPDLSLLFANLASGEQGYICIDGAGKNRFEIPLDFIGGRGKFEGASGGALVKGEAEPIDSRGNFLGETGTLKGLAILP